MTSEVYTILFAAVFCSQAAAVHVEVNEAVLEEGANGTAVVLLSVAHIQQAAIFIDDNELLRRIAYIETRDGTDTESEDGGIWAVSEAAFEITKDTRSIALLDRKHEQILLEFNIGWQSVQLSDLRRPLYSALAARLVLFAAPRAIPSNTDVEAQAQFWRENYNTDGSVNDFIQATRELQGGILESSASDFYVGFARNDADGPMAPTLMQQLFVTTREPDPVPFTVDTLLGFHFTGVATRDSTTVVPLGNSYQVFDSSEGSERNKGIHVSAGDKEIVVYGLNFEDTTSDAYLALPCSRMAVDQYEYYAISYHAFRVSQLLFVGCEDDTTISFLSTTITLNEMETYLHEMNSDITGTRIISNKPISFFTGHQCTNIPTTERACDHLTEQVPPTAIWGTNFLSASFSGRMSGEIYRILASQPSTSVSVNCDTYTQPETYSLATAGAWQEFMTPDDSYCVIESNKPLLAFEFGLANELDGIGDPFMMMLPPIEQYSNNYVFDVLADFSTNFITIFVPPEYFEPENIFVDDMSQDLANWIPINCQDSTVCGYATYASLEPGEHRLYHSDTLARIGVSAYGFNRFNSYGYPGGLQLVPIQLATVSFSQEMYSVRENEKTLKVSVVRSGDTESHVVVLISNNPFEGSATAGQDYSTITEILEFQSGETGKEVEIRVTDDNIIEIDESFILFLSSGVGVFLSPFDQVEITIINDDGTIQLSPNYGNQLGGAPLLVSGTTLTFEEEDSITCTFSTVHVSGVYVNQKQALCVSPELSETGTVLFQLEIVRDDSDKSDFIGQVNYISLPFEKAFEVYVESNDSEPVFDIGTTVKVYWSPQSIFPLLDKNSFTIDIALSELDTDSGEWSILVTLASDLPNSGTATVTLSNIQTTRRNEEIIRPVVVEVGISSTSTSGILSEVGQLGLRILKQSPVRIVQKLPQLTQSSLQRFHRFGCRGWADSQPSNIGQQINSRLPPCPCTEERARLPSSGFEEDRQSSIVKVIGTVQEFTDTAIIDDAFRSYFHPGAAACYRQRVTDLSQTEGSGQQCCYDEQGNIIVGPSSGGTVDLVSADVSFLDHFEDVLPFWLCCKGPQQNLLCRRFYEHRPSDDCTRSIPPPIPAITGGDPHFRTLDGFQYTFNGRGEFTLIETADDSFILQGRMVDIAQVNGTSAAATVFSAIVAREGHSDIVQFEISANESIVALVNGELVDFSIVEQEFRNVTVTDLGNETLSAIFSSGAYLQVIQENGIISSVIISLPVSYNSTGIQGLLGNFNGDISDDLLARLSSTPLPLNSTLQEIHESFGLTWIIDTPGGSMFYYQSGKSWATYFDPNFEPVYQPVFGDPDLEMEATRLCGDDTFCLFDVAATGSIEIGRSTLQISKQIEEIENLSVPISCDYPCENGACVANNTCACSEGFSGDTCADITVVPECPLDLLHRYILHGAFENPCKCRLSSTETTD